MDSASLQFVFFGLAAALISNFSPSRVWRSGVLMAVSIIFLALLAPDPVMFVPLVGFLALGYVTILLIRRGWSKILTISVIAVVFAYVWLKKYTFLPAGIFIDHPYFTLGLSYIFFRVTHLVVDTGEGDQQNLVTPFSYLLYTLNFTTLVSGPIQRYDEFARDQFAEVPIGLSAAEIGQQLERIVIGFFKVNVMSLVLHAVQEDALAQMHGYIPLSMRLLAGFRLAVVYPFYLYLNFSGYIDIVIALARLMRVRLPENFDRPFSASSFIDFWNRWHITLSTWLKNYVYNPLLMALMRRISSVEMQPLLGVFCFFVTFFLVGIWHGRTSEFVIFGILQGGGVAANKLWQIGMGRALGNKRYKALAKDLTYVSFARGLTFAWFTFTLFWFWAAWTQIGTIFGSLNASQWIAVWLAVWLVAAGVLAAWEWLREVVLSVRTSDGPVLESRYVRVVYATALGLAGLAITFLLNQPPPTIVYKTF
jgi:alginate O-acetyltransferase complex protein AlgI